VAPSTPAIPVAPCIPVAPVAPVDPIAAVLAMESHANPFHCQVLPPAEYVSPINVGIGKVIGIIFIVNDSLG
jgi:hypothetical protein